MLNLACKDERLPLACRMAELREQHGRIQQECAGALGVGQSTYSGMEAGERHTIGTQRRVRHTGGKKKARP